MHALNALIIVLEVKLVILKTAAGSGGKQCLERAQRIVAALLVPLPFKVLPRRAPL